MPKYVYELVKCPYCDEYRKSTGLHKHVKTHGDVVYAEFMESNKNIPKFKLIDDIFYCNECEYSASTRQSVTSHWWRQHTLTGKTHIAGRKDGCIAWNKGMSKEDHPSLMIASQKISATLLDGYASGRILPVPQSESVRAATSERMSLHNPGGRTKWYKVYGISVQGTYERDFAEALVAQNISWEKVKTNNHIFKYVKDDKIKSYAPDFYLSEMNLYVEIKGFWWGDDENKMLCVKEQCSNKNVVVIFGRSKLDAIISDIKKNLPLEPVWSW